MVSRNEQGKIIYCLAKKIGQTVTLIVEMVSRNEQGKIIYCLAKKNGQTVTLIVEMVSRNEQEWSECDANCGDDVQKRTRATIQGNDTICTSNFEEQPCTAPVTCAPVCVIDGVSYDDNEEVPTSDPCKYWVTNTGLYCQNSTEAIDGLQKLQHLYYSLVNGNWTLWSAWSTCSSTCNGGMQSRTRSCSDPSPQCGGLQCDGPTTEQQPCNIHVSCK
ncbi:hypothetical protein KUTeg_010945 [Tegillarca granosa]|uniref:Uncharacterized protein n=1 Tax=Tegillarca granosa TaxID=220873 RepID=A0ABQ9F5Q1_TEGGR|nr:hypothetical protein KUTeg_010945 [Tegillarca granosa]